MGVLLNDRRKMKFFTEVAVPEDSRLIGQGRCWTSTFSNATGCG